MKKILYSAIAAAAVLAGVVSYAQAANVKVSANLDKPYVLAGEDETVVLKVGLSAEPGVEKTKRPPINIAVVIDKSGSMSSDGKIEKAKEGVYRVIEQLNEGDVISIIVYDTYPSVLVYAQPVRGKSALINMVSQIYPSGSTALYGGIELGAQELRKYASDYSLNKIVLLSDGLANVGLQSTEDLANLGRALGDEGFIVSTVGVGLDYNEDLMTSLARESGG
ncbi:MAG: VWA domain-containing protein, partial [Candidatus Omnitrophica bacterium]|nr:VWA domain-containing protein [Candidatus Omnitrophota bacterium]